MNLRNASPWKIGLLQSAVVLSYILLFTLALQTLHSVFGNIPDNPLIDMPLFLTMFVFSALVCSSAILGYPLTLLFERNVRRAVTIVCWSAGWLAIFLAMILTIAMQLSR